MNLTLNFDTLVKNVLKPISYIITCRLNNCPQLNHLEKNGPHQLQTNLIQSTKPFGKCSKRVKCSLGQVCVCHGQTNKLIGLWKVLAYFPQIQMSKFVLDSIFAAKIYPIFTILFILKYLWDQKLNNRFLLSLSKKLQRKQNKEIFRWYFVS